MKKILKALFWFLLFQIVAVIFTWPLILHLGDAFMGALDKINTRDPLAYAWDFAWFAHQIFADPSKIWDANIFYPRALTFAFNENHFVFGLLALPLQVFGDPIFSTNFIYIFGYGLSIWGGFLLVRYLTKNNWAALFGALVWALASPRFGHLMHFHYFILLWFPFVFLFLIKYLREQRLRDLVIFAIFMLVQIFSGLYLAMIALVCCTVFVLAYLALQREKWTKKLSAYALSIGAVLILALSVLYPYFKLALAAGHTWSIWAGLPFSASLDDYLIPHSQGILYHSGFFDNWHLAQQPKESAWEVTLFVGASVWLLSWVGLGRKGSRRLLLSLSVPAMLAFILSLGPYVGKWPSPLYWLFYKVVPGFSSMRAPARWGELVFLFLAVMSAFGFVFLKEKLQRVKSAFVSKNASVLLFVLATAALFLEFLPVPIPLTAVTPKDKIPQVYRWLGEQKEDFAIVELPIYFGDDNWKEEERMYFSTFHWKKMVNGFVAFDKDYPEQAKLVQGFPNKSAIAYLKNIKVKYVIFHRDQFSESITEQVLQKTKIIKDFGNDLVLEI